MLNFAERDCEQGQRDNNHDRDTGKHTGHQYKFHDKIPPIETIASQPTPVECGIFDLDQLFGRVVAAT